MFFKFLKVIVQSYIIGISFILASALVLALYDVKINPINNALIWNICAFVIGSLFYIIKQ